MSFIEKGKLSIPDNHLNTISGFGDDTHRTCVNNNKDKLDKFSFFFNRRESDKRNSDVGKRKSADKSDGSVLSSEINLDNVHDIITPREYKHSVVIKSNATKAFKNLNLQNIDKCVVSGANNYLLTPSSNVTANHRNTFNTKSPFAIFEKSLKSSRGSRQDKKSSRQKLHKNSKVNNNINYFSISINENVNINEDDEFDLKLPLSAQKEIAEKTVKIKEDNKALYEEIVDIINSIQAKNETFEENKKDEEKLTKELKEIKAERNKLIAEKSVLANELDFIKVI